jgi:hypothetical protein
VVFPIDPVTVTVPLVPPFRVSDCALALLPSTLPVSRMLLPGAWYSVTRWW